MQGIDTVPDTSRAVLVERIQVNRRVLEDTVARLSAALAEVQSQRALTGRLIVEVGQAFAGLSQNRASVRAARRGDRTPVPALPRYNGETPDPLDRAREKLHQAYAETADPALRAELMASYDGFARALALKYRHRESVDDLVQVARIGLLHAIDRFDPGLGRPFPLFARITITGELKRHIRDRTWAMRVPRSLQEDYLNVMRAVDDLTAEHSGSPSMDALAARCGVSVERILEAMELRASQRALSIDAPTGPTSDVPLPELGHDDVGFRHLENRQLLAQLLGRLPERDRRIVELRFLDELTQSQIAAQVGVSQMCVSRVLTRTLGRLRLWARTAAG